MPRFWLKNTNMKPCYIFRVPKGQWSPLDSKVAFKLQETKVYGITGITLVHGLCTLVPPLWKIQSVLVRSSRDEPIRWWAQQWRRSQLPWRWLSALVEKLCLEEPMFFCQTPGKDEKLGVYNACWYNLVVWCCLSLSILVELCEDKIG